MNRSYRLTQIIHLLTQENNFISVNKIAYKLDCSPKTIRNDLHYLEENLPVSKAHLEKIPSKGIKLVLSDSNYEISKSFCQKSSIMPMQIKERIFCLSLVLLINGSLKPKDAIKKLYISRSTFYADMLKVSENFEKFKIKLVRKKKKDIGVVAKERYIRACLLDIFMHAHWDKQYSELFKAEKFDVQKNARLHSIRESKMFQFINNFINAEEFLLFTASVFSHLPDLLNLHFSPMPIPSRTTVSTILLISLIRIKACQYVKLSEQFVEYLNNHKHKAIQTSCFQLLDSLEAILDLQISTTERLYLQFYFMTLGRQSAKLGLEYDNETALHIYNDIFQYLLDNYKIDIRPDESLKQSILNHASKLIIRLLHNINIDNPNKEMIKSCYSLSYAISEHILCKYANEFETTISDEEIAYIAVLIELALEKYRPKVNCLLICLEDATIASLIKAKINASFPNLNINIITDINLLSLSSSTGYSFILSTITLNEYDWDYILINPIITETDLMRIKLKLKKLQSPESN